MEEMSLVFALYRKNLILKERLEAIVRYAEGANYIDKKAILLIAGLEEEKDE